jgi:hypothetical protein
MAQENLPQPCTGPKQELIPFLKGNKWGFCDRDKKLVIPAVYDAAFPFGVVPEDEEKLFYPKQDEAVVRKGKQLLFINARGETKLAEGIDHPGQQIVQQLNEGSWRSNYETNGKKGFVLKGDTVVPAIYDDVQRLARGEYFVRLNGKAGMLDKDGKTWLAPAEFEDIQPENLKGGGRSYQVMSKNIRWGLYVNGKALMPAEYRLIRQMGAWSFDWYQVQRNDGKWQLADANGQPIGAAYDNMGGYDPGTDRMKVSSNGKWGFIDSKGQVQVPCKYASVEDYHYMAGLAKVNDGKRSFYIGCTGVEYCLK